jgi:predicted dehydrogenase
MPAPANVTGRLRFSVVGLGQRMAAVLSAFKRAGASFSIDGYFDPEPVGLARLTAEGLSPGQAYGSIEQAVTSGGKDLILIGSPNHLHAEHLMLALYGGTPVFVEKPIVRTESESYFLAERLGRSATPDLYVGLVMRSAPLVKEVLSVVRRGGLGQIVSMDATEHLPPEHGAYLARNWRRHREWGGSFLLDKACHDFDILAEIAGARPARISSFGGRGIFRHDRAPAQQVYSSGEPAFKSWPGGWAAEPDAFHSSADVTDHQTALVQYANGVQLSFHSNSSTALRERRWYISGTEGTLIADLTRNTLMWRRSLELNAPERKQFDLSEDDHNGADVAMVQDLMAALNGTAAYPVSAFHALEAGLTVMAVDRAMHEGRVIDCSAMWTTLDAASGV